MITVYEVLKSSGVKFNTSDLSSIGMKTSNAIPEVKKRTKIESKEGKKTFKVFPYEDSEREIIEGIIIKHFSRKNKS